MNTTLKTALLSFTLALPAATALADGQALHDGNCMQCHDSSVYTRKDRRVSSLDGLGKQVRRCESSLGLRWFDEDVQQVVDYLNTQYYGFK